MALIDVDALLATELEHDWGAATRTAHAPASGDAKLERACALAERLPPSVAGHGGDAALLHAATEIATVLGPDAASIQLVLAEVFNVRCQPAWPVAKIAREARRAATRQDTPEAKYARRKAERRAEAPAAATPEGPRGTPATGPAASAVFLMTRKGRDVWYYDPRVNEYRECGRDSLHVALQTSGAEAYVETRAGAKRLSAQAILENGPTAIVRDVVTDFTRAGEAEYDAAAPGGAVLLGVAPPEIAPLYDAAAAEWLDAISGGGAHLAALHEWIASCAQGAMHRLATALCVVGKHSAGKTLLAIAIGRLWGAPPVELKAVVAQFNASMATSPVVFDDECATISRRLISTEDFRVLVQNRTRSYEPKGKERRTLNGAQRFILTANDLGALTFSNAVGVGAADAIAERLTVLSAALDGDVAQRCADALDRLRLDDGEIDFTRLDAHMAHVRDTTALPDGRVRFLGALEDRAIARAAVLTSTLTEHEALYDRIRALLVGTLPPTGALFLAEGAVWVRVGALADALSTSQIADRWTPGRVRSACAPFETSPMSRMVAGVRAWELDAARLIEALGVPVPAALATLTAAG